MVRASPLLEVSVEGGVIVLTTYEFARIASEPVLPVLHGDVRKLLKGLTEGATDRPSILDVGGRNSPYTVGLAADVAVLDTPRTSEIERKLHLGFTDEIRDALRRRRSNVSSVILGDMTRSRIPSNRFDGVVSVEVIEHVSRDEQFVRQLQRVLKPGGWLLLTTPNGDYVRNEPPDYNPDHLRHYRREELIELLTPQFARVEVFYAVRTSMSRYRGLKAISWRHPLKSMVSMYSNVRNHVESLGVQHQSRRTAHLVAVCYKHVAAPMSMMSRRCS